jgi:hypothetical protein
MPLIIPLTLSAATTLTSPQLLQGFIIYTGGAANLTMPTAADLCNNIQGCMVGTSFEFEVRSSGAATVTIVVGTGGTLSGTGTVATLSTRTFFVNFTNVTLGSEAYTVYTKDSGTY